MFERRGFESVTLAEVAAAANVSVKTVVSYFGAKEDLFFDAEPAVLDVLDVLAAAVAGCGSLRDRRDPPPGGEQPRPRRAVPVGSGRRGDVGRERRDD
jgi:Bacterial regulatory proteins, tetR family